MKIVKYICDLCQRRFEGENNKEIITFETTENCHICTDCFEKYCGKDIAKSIEYIQKVKEINS